MTREPTKAGLAAAVAKLTEENAGLRDLLAAVSECARSVPQATYDDARKELRRATHMLVDISVVTGPDGSWTWGWATGDAAAFLRKSAAEPLGYEPYAEPEPAPVIAGSEQQPAPVIVAEHCSGCGESTAHADGCEFMPAAPVPWSAVMAEPAPSGMQQPAPVARVLKSGRTLAAGEPVRDWCPAETVTDDEVLYCDRETGHAGSHHAPGPDEGSEVAWSDEAAAVAL